MKTQIFTSLKLITVVLFSSLIFTQVKAQVTVQVSCTGACSGACNGKASATASGGTPSYTYLWSNGAATQITTGLCPGIYTVTISDANGSTATANCVVISSSPMATASASPNTITAGSSTTLTASGGGTYSWSNGANGSSITVTPTVTTMYCVMVTEANGCTDISCVNIYVVPAGINEAHYSDFISVHPNPSNGKFTIEWDREQGTKGELEIYNVLGEKVYEAPSLKGANNSTLKGGGQTLDLSSQPSGIYFLKIINPDRSSAVKKIIKE